MNTNFLIGLFGSLLLVSGAAYPEGEASHPAKSVKNWLFAVGGFVMFLFSLLNYMDGGAIFYVLLEFFVVVASIFMMLNTPDNIDTPIITATGVGLIAWSLYLFEGYSTIFFIIGLSGIGLGYALDTGSLKREVALTIGSALIALFSYIEASWIFFWLNVFFAIFSGYYVWKIANGKKLKHHHIHHRYRNRKPKLQLKAHNKHRKAAPRRALRFA